MKDGLYYVALPFAVGGVIVETKQAHNTPGCPGYTLCPRVIDGAPIFGRFWSVDASLTVFYDWVLKNRGKLEWVGPTTERQQ